MAIAVRRTELLRACDGDEEQLELVLGLLRKDGGGRSLTVAVDPPRVSRASPPPTALPLRGFVAAPPPRQTLVAVRTAESAVRTADPDECPHCVGKRATRYATSMRDLEENPVDFTCGSCGRILDGPAYGD